MKRFYSLAEFATEEINALLGLAQRLESRPEPRALEGRVLALLFLNASLRTQASFQAAMARLGGGSFVISPAMGIHGLEMRQGVVMDGDAAEHLLEAVPVLASYGDALGIRVFAERKSLTNDLSDALFRALAELVDGPVINMESAIDHPCQSLADWKTLDELDVPRAGGRFVLSWANHPKALPLAVPAATLHMAAQRGMDVTVLRPEGYALPEALMRRAGRVAEAAGGTLQETDDRSSALRGAHVVYAKSWCSTRHYGDDMADGAQRARLHDWCVDEPWFETARGDCRFMHCLPVRRNVVVADRVLDGPRSVVVAQARNRMYAQMAVLHTMLGDTSQ